jgi:hypothetical protein
VLGLRLLGVRRGEFVLVAGGGRGAGPSLCRGGHGGAGWLLVAPMAVQTQGEGRIHTQPTLANPRQLHGSIRDQLEVIGPAGGLVAWAWRGRSPVHGRGELTGGIVPVPAPPTPGLYELCLGPAQPPADADPDAWLCWPFAVTE